MVTIDSSTASVAGYGGILKYEQSEFPFLATLEPQVALHNRSNMPAEVWVNVTNLTDATNRKCSLAILPEEDEEGPATPTDGYVAFNVPFVAYETQQIPGVQRFLIPAFSKLWIEASHEDSIMVHISALFYR